MIAIVLFVHKDLDQVRRLINTLNHPEVDIYMHVDLKCPFNAEDFKDINITKQRWDIKWADESQVSALFSSLKEINDDYDYYLFMSGQDYLIVPIDKLIKFLYENKGKEFIDVKKIEDENIANRYLKYHTKKRYLDAILRRVMPKRKIFEGMETFYGSNWWILTDDSIKYLIQEYDQKFKAKLKFTSCIDEVFYQTVLMNSEFKDKIVNDNIRYIDWSEHQKGINSGNPNILVKNDYNKIINSGKFIARKFDSKKDSAILDMLDDYRKNG